MDRVMMVATNVAAVPAIIIIRDDTVYRVLLHMSMMASIVFHAKVGATVSTFYGRMMHTGFDGTHNQYSSDTWLFLDQLFAFLAMVGTLNRFGPIRSWPRSCQIHAQFAMTVMLIGEMVSLHTTHVIAHTMWHIAAFSLPWHLESNRLFMISQYIKSMYTS